MHEASQTQIQVPYQNDFSLCNRHNVWRLFHFDRASTRLHPDAWPKDTLEVTGRKKGLGPFGQRHA
jgi:hypothetical protein